MEIETLGVPAIITAIVGSAGLYWRSLLAERAASIKTDRERLVVERTALDAQTKERISEARAREDALRQELKAEREAHIATTRNLGIALDALGDEMRERDAAQARMLLEQSQKVLDAIKDRKASQAAVRAAREVARLSSPGEPPEEAPEEEPRAPHRHPRPVREADASARRRALAALTEEEAEHVLDPRRR